MYATLRMPTLHGFEHFFRRGVGRLAVASDLVRNADRLQRLLVGLGALEG